MGVGGRGRIREASEEASATIPARDGGGSEQGLAVE